MPGCQSSGTAHTAFILILLLFQGQHGEEGAEGGTEPGRRRLQHQGWKTDGLGAAGTMRQEPGRGKGEVAMTSPQGQHEGQGHTRLLQLSDVDQGSVLGAAEHLLQPLQAHLQLVLSRRLLQRLLHLLGVEGGAAQEPGEGTQQRPAQADALLGLAVAAGTGERQECDRREAGMCSLCAGKLRH